MAFKRWVFFVFVSLFVDTLCEAQEKEPLTGEKLLKYLKTKPDLWKSQPLTDSQFNNIPFGGNKDQPTSHQIQLKLGLQMKLYDFYGQIPRKFDSRQKWPHCSSIGTIQDQASCWSCWAVSMVEVANDRLCIQTQGRVQVQLSAIDLTSCCENCGNGCASGYPRRAWEYFRSEGLVTGGSYSNHTGCKPYVFAECGPSVQNGNKWQCSQERPATPVCERQCQRSHNRQYQQDKYFGRDIYYPRNEEEMQREIMERGPIQVTFDVYEDFYNYKNGVYYHQWGEKRFSHVVKLLGWGVESGVPYWLAANSWNTGWGANGFFKIARGVNMCGIEQWAVAGSVDESRLPSLHTSFNENGGNNVYNNGNYPGDLNTKDRRKHGLKRRNGRRRGSRDHNVYTHRDSWNANQQGQNRWNQYSYPQQDGWNWNYPRGQNVYQGWNSYPQQNTQYFNLNSDGKWSSW